MWATFDLELLHLQRVAAVVAAAEAATFAFAASYVARLPVDAVAPAAGRL